MKIGKMVFRIIAGIILFPVILISSLIIYQDIDATNIPYENYFDIIVFKSIIGGIGRNNNFIS